MFQVTANLQAFLLGLMLGQNAFLLMEAMGDRPMDRMLDEWWRWAQAAGWVWPDAVLHKPVSIAKARQCGSASRLLYALSQPQRR